jgi:hypothetical protein
VANVQNAALQVHICPGQPQRFALPQAERERDREQRLQPVASNCGQEAVCLFWGERLDFVVLAPRRLDEPGDVAADHAPPLCLRQRR